MTDAEYADLLVRFTRIRDDWEPILPAGWRIHYVYERGRDEDAPHCVMKCKADWRYCEAVITVYLETIWIKELTDDELRFYYVHEAMHVHLNQCREYTDNWQVSDLNHEERVATNLANASIAMTNAIADRWRKYCPAAECPVIAGVARTIGERSGKDDASGQQTAPTMEDVRTEDAVPDAV